MTQPAATTTRAAPPPPSPLAAGPASAAEPLDRRAARLIVSGATAAVSLFLILRIDAWAPHEDETLALFVGADGLVDALRTVHGERGGAPLHFVLAWAVAHAGGGLVGLRLLSAVFAAASVPLVGALGARLAGRTTGVIASVLVAGSWMLLFHGIYARMYSLFLCTSALSYLLLLRALERGGRGRWAAWVAATLLTVAAHPSGALVIASQGLYVLVARTRVREALVAFAAVAVLGTPFWITDLVLAGRFDVGVGGGGEKLGNPLRVAVYLWHVAGDFTTGWRATTAVVLVLAAAGARLLWRRNRSGALLAAAVFGTPTAAFVAARLGASAAPETRHLIFALPFFATLLALPFAKLVERGRVRAAAAAVAVVVVAEVGWAWSQTPTLFRGDPQAHAHGRAAAAAWLARTARPDDVLLGYEPAFLAAWERNRSFPRTVLPRADARLAADELRGLRRPLGRGIWVFDAYDTNNVDQRLAIAPRAPRPASAFEVRAFGPYVVVRTRRATVTPLAYLRRAAAAQVVGKALALGDADINFETMSRAAERLGYRASTPSSRSTSSR